MNTPQTPDYGEPWDASGGYVRNKLNKDVHLYAYKKRIASCVNACAGMVDPAKEIEAMRAAISEAYAALDACSHNLHSAYGKLSDNADAAIAKLQPFTTQPA